MRYNQYGGDYEEEGYATVMDYPEILVYNTELSPEINQELISVWFVSKHHDSLASFVDYHVKDLVECLG